MRDQGRKLGAGTGRDTDHNAAGIGTARGGAELSLTVTCLA